MINQSKKLHVIILARILAIVAHNRLGQAHVVACEVKRCSDQDEPSKAPRNLRLMQIEDSKSPQFQWQPVSPSPPNGPFVRYKMQTSKDDECEQFERHF